MDVKASIIIRCKDEAPSIGRVLDGVFAQDLDFGYEVLVIDSGSTDGTLGIVAGFDCRLIEIPPEKFSYGYAMNLGAMEARGEVLVYLSAHCQPVDERWLESLLAPLSDTGVAAVFGRQVGEPGVNPFEEWRLARSFPGKDAGLQLYMFSSANAAVRKSAWELLYFDEKLPFSEDRAWARDAAEHGMKIAYAPDAGVYHSHPFSLSGVRERARAAGWAKKQIYGDECRFDSVLWIAGAFAYCVFKDLTYFIANGYWSSIRHILSYRFLEVSGFRSGALEYMQSGR